MRIASICLGLLLSLFLSLSFTSFTYAATLQVILTWQAGANATNYSIEQKTGSGSYAAVANTTNLTHTISNLPLGNTHCFRIMASNSIGNASGYSNECCSAGFLPEAATGLSCSESVVP